MRVRWTSDAANDLERICDFIAESSPGAARRVAKTILEGISSLTAFPNRGRLGRVEGTREFVFAALPSLPSTKCTTTCASCASCTAHNGGRIHRYLQSSTISRRR